MRYRESCLAKQFPSGKRKPSARQPGVSPFIELSRLPGYDNRYARGGVPGPLWSYRQWQRLPFPAQLPDEIVPTDG
ncbi:Uncharacterised protein [Mycobacteroides abscessus subsp. abscessus]|nr:Uncharacterised protein [Mycobacteroides abscessus subsp. abscessus]SIL69095.1 Uncharacterised protein [Mycobacteroides abscessus subsp. abscessus]SIM54454.1 Uncharacterised protein [Mycobacteroides abscessus subsp. abscessus]SLF30270.1 Uncharacterised protein [Mycobacteroides abscessus subsp. abscessus]SLH73596.1 Uncharacterised protein [Mycobacteroides abscessus subsp. abscessus]